MRSSTSADSNAADTKVSGFSLMLETYRRLLDAIVRRDFDVFSERVRLSRFHKPWLAARSLPVRWEVM